MTDVSVTGTARPSRWRLVSAFFAIYIIWGSAYIAIHFAIQTIPPFLGASGRFLLAGGLLYLWMRSRGAPNPTRKQWLAATIAGFLFFVLNNGLLVWSEQIVPSGTAALIIGSIPIFMVIIDWLRPGGHRPTLPILLGLILGTVGLALLVNPAHMLVPGDRAWIGIGALVVASFGWAAGSIYNQHADLPHSSLMSTAAQLLTGGVMLAVISVITGETTRFNAAQVTPVSLGAILYLALASSIFGFGSFIWLMRVSKPSLVSTYAYVNPIVALFLGWLLASEHLTGQTLIAAAIILGSVMLINQARQHDQPGDAEKTDAQTIMPEMP